MTARACGRQRRLRVAPEAKSRAL